MFETNDKLLTIIIVNWNNAPDTLQTVSSITSWTTIKPRVIVIDNNSSMEDFSSLNDSGLPFQLIRNSINQGYGSANNTGIKRAILDGSEYVLLLNADAFCSEECVSSLLDIMANTPHLGVTGPLLEEGGELYAGGRNIGVYSTTRIPYKSNARPQGMIPVDYIPGTVLLTRKDIIEKVGLLDEDYFFSGEIADFCWRVNSSGMFCGVFTRCKASHNPDTESTIRETLYNYYILRNRFLFIRKHYGYFKAVLILRWVASGLVQTVFSLLAGRKDIAVALWNGVGDGLIGRFGDRNELFIS